VDNPNHELKPGMPADAIIQLAPASQISNPSTAAQPKP